jgi:hypothetical protein
LHSTKIEIALNKARCLTEAYSEPAGDEGYCFERFAFMVFLKSLPMIPNKFFSGFFLVFFN